MCAKFGYDRSTPFSPRTGWSCQPNFSLAWLPLASLGLASLLYSCSPVGPKRLDRFPRSMAQNTWIGVRKCLLYDRTLSYEFQGAISPKNYPKSPPDAKIPAKFKISNFRCNFWASGPIFMKFETKLEFTNRKWIEARSWLNDEIQDGGDRHLENRQTAITFEPLNRFSPNLTGKKLRWRFIGQICPNRHCDEIQDGGGRHLENMLSAITFEPFNRFSPFLTGKKHR